MSDTHPDRREFLRRAARTAVGAALAAPFGRLARAQDAAQPGPVTLFADVRIFDGRGDSLSAPSHVLVRGGKIERISAIPIPTDRSAATTVLNCGGRTLLPGLIDAHVHLTLPYDFQEMRSENREYVQFRSAAEAKKTLMRGFTTVRDMCGPVFGLKQAIDEGIVDGPRIYPSGAMVSQTSGHGDFRLYTGKVRDWTGEQDLLEELGYGVVADGPAEVLTAVREQLRLGATQVKVAAGGGITSLGDPIDVVEFSVDEIRAAVGAAQNWGTYVAVHAYTPGAIKESLEAGVVSIEHGMLIDEPTMALLAKKGAYLSPQAELFSMKETPPGTTVTPLQAQRGAQVAAGLDSEMTLAKKYKVKMAFGTDLFGSAAKMALEPQEFTARLKWFTPAEILRQATSVNASLLALCGPRNPYPGKLGVVEEGALADLVLVDGDPLADLSLLADPDKNVVVVMKDGRIYKRTLPGSA